MIKGLLDFLYFAILVANGMGVERQTDTVFDIFQPLWITQVFEEFYPPEFAKNVPVFEGAFNPKAPSTQFAKDRINVICRKSCRKPALDNDRASREYDLQAPMFVGIDDPLFRLSLSPGSKLNCPTIAYGRRVPRVVHLQKYPCRPLLRFLTNSADGAFSSRKTLHLKFFCRKICPSLGLPHGSCHVNRAQCCGSRFFALQQHEAGNFNRIGGGFRGRMRLFEKAASDVQRPADESNRSERANHHQPLGQGVSQNNETVTGLILGCWLLFVSFAGGYVATRRLDNLRWVMTSVVGTLSVGILSLLIVASIYGHGY
mgnify:CR=1 FL=1